MIHTSKTSHRQDRFSIPPTSFSAQGLKKKVAVPIIDLTTDAIETATETSEGVKKSSSLLAIAPLSASGESEATLVLNTVDVNPWDDIDLQFSEIDEPGPGAPPSLRPAQWWSEAHPPATLHDDILQLCSYLSPTAHEEQMRSDVVGRFTGAVRSIFPRAQVKLFGSSATGLSLPRSDIDLVVMPSVETSFGHWKMPRPLYALANVLQRRELAANIEVVAHASVPIIKAVDARSSCCVDICFDRPEGPQNTEIVRSFLTRMPVLRPLVLVLKYFLYQRGLNEPFRGGLGAYALTMMVVSFLQQHITPPWDLASCDLGQLFIRFLVFYGESFNYFRTGISVANGGSYFSKTRQHLLSHPDQPWLLVIEDPHLPSNNVGRSAYEILRIAGVFRDAGRQILSCVPPSTRALILSKPRVNSSLLPPYLGKVLLIRHDVVAFRERICSSYSLSNKRPHHTGNAPPPSSKHSKRF